MTWNANRETMRDYEIEDIENALSISEEDAVTGVVVHEQLRLKFEQIFKTISEREAGIIKMRFGLEDGKPKTLSEIAEVYGVTRERIRQIEAKTMSKLRHPMRSQQIIDFLDE